MKYIYFLFFLFISITGFCQSKKIWILDSITKKPISDVLFHSSKGDFFSSLKGEVIVNKNFSETVHLQHLGYKIKDIQFTPALDTLFLIKQAYKLGEVNITQQKQPHYFEIGYYNSGTSFFKKRTLVNNLCILAVYIPYTVKSTYINEILLSIKSRKYAEAYNVYLYQPDSTGKPGKVMYKKYIIVDSLKKEGVINIRDLDIQLPKNGIFVGLENLKIYDYETHHPLSGMGIRFEYSKEIDRGKVYILLKNPKLNLPKIWLPEEIKPNTHRVPCFGLQVYHK